MKKTGHSKNWMSIFLIFFWKKIIFFRKNECPFFFQHRRAVTNTKKRTPKQETDYRGYPKLWNTRPTCGDLKNTFFSSQNNKSGLRSWRIFVPKLWNIRCSSPFSMLLLGWRPFATIQHWEARFWVDQCFIILGTLCRGFLRHFAHKWGKPFSGFRKSCAGCSTFPVKMGKSESSHSTTPPPRRPQRVTNVALPRWPPLARSPLEARTSRFFCWKKWAKAFWRTKPPTWFDQKKRGAGTSKTASGTQIDIWVPSDHQEP